jgi:uncharacterized protein
MGFQWDPAKDAANKAKHLVGFREAAEIFRGFVLVREDDRRDYGERRLVALGAYDGQVLRVVYTPRGEDIRIISAWRAGRDERETYARARGDRQV